jgi:hypothetical protein
MKIARRTLCWMSCLAAVTAFGATPPGQFPDVSAIERSEVLLTLGHPVTEGDPDPLRVFSVTSGMCCGTYWFSDSQCTAEYEGFGGAVIAYFDCIAPGLMALRSFEVGIDNRGRVPLPEVLCRLRPNMTMREVEQALAGQSSREAVCGSAGAWQRRSYASELQRGLIDPSGRVMDAATHCGNGQSECRMK